MKTVKPVIAGNWKMHKSPEEASAFFREFLTLHDVRQDRSVLFFPTALALQAAHEAVGAREDIGLGVQNVFWETAGAYTGEISAPLARAAGASHVLVGHSERRHVFGETIADTGRKLSASLDAGMIPVLCVGELLDERRASRAEVVVGEQLDGALEGLPADRVAGILVAYEPVWAIGTGETASPDDAAAMHGFIRQRLTDRYGSATAGDIPVLYGGSVKPDNAAELLAAPEVNGLLVGGASLDPSGFARICAAPY
jgi:triosephosphate isomerase (TIM)